MAENKTIAKQMVEAKKFLKEGKIVSISVLGVGAYTVGMDNHDLPDVVVIDNTDDESDERALFISNLVVNFYHHIAMMVESKQSSAVVEHIDYYLDEEQCARFLLRKVEMEKPWEHLAVQRDLQPNDALVQIHLPDGKNRILGEKDYTPHAKHGERLFETTPDVFY